LGIELNWATHQAAIVVWIALKFLSVEDSFYDVCLGEALFQRMEHRVPSDRILISFNEPLDFRQPHD